MCSKKLVSFTKYGLDLNLTDEEEKADEEDMLFRRRSAGTSRIFWELRSRKCAYSNDFDADPNDANIKSLMWMLFETALLISGFSLPESVVFADRIYKLMKFGLNVYDEKEAGGLNENNTLTIPMRRSRFRNDANHLVVHRTIKHMRVLIRMKA
eukprot:741621_1